MKIATVAGARPQFIKAAVVSRALKKFPHVSEFIIHTGQHYDDNMSRIFFDEMEIPEPLYNLGIKENLHGAMTGAMISGIEKILMNEKPDYVLIYGDTNSTLAGALAASKLHIPVAHVEAGLRSYNRQMPEEINRIIADQLSTQLFCPSQNAVDNLIKEGFDKGPHTMHISGDVMYDAALYYASKNKSNILEQLHLKKNDFILCTIHRAENTNDISRLKSIAEALNTIQKNIPVVLPLHPRTKAVMKKENIKIDCMVIEPVGYFDMLTLLQNTALVITDSGGLQKESYYFKNYCIVLRDQTEWTELLENNCCILTGANANTIIETAQKLSGKKIETAFDIYGTGHAGDFIANILQQQN